MKLVNNEFVYKLEMFVQLIERKNMAASDS